MHTEDNRNVFLRKKGIFLATLYVIITFPCLVEYCSGFSFSKYILHHFLIKEKHPVDREVREKTVMIFRDRHTQSSTQKRGKEENRIEYRKNKTWDGIHNLAKGNVPKNYFYEVTARPSFASNNDPCKVLFDSEKDKADGHEFQPVYNTEMFVVSAFKDVRSETPTITILGITPLAELKKSLQCVLFINNAESGFKTVMVPLKISLKYAQLDNLAVHWKQIVITCLTYQQILQSKKVTFSDIKYVSVSKKDNQCHRTNNLIRLREVGFTPGVKMLNSPIPTLNSEVNFTGHSQYKTLAMCLPTMYNLPASMAGSVVEFMEIHKQLGYEKIFIYGIKNSSQAIHDVLQYYEQIGLVEIVKWDVPVPTYLKETFDFCRESPSKAGCHMNDR